MNKKVSRLVNFLKIGIWKIDKSDVSPLRYLFYEVIKKVILAIKFFTTKRVMNSAAALTYSTLLAIVPIMAVVFAIARGFGYSKYIEAWFRDALTSQPKVAETIIGFVNSYLVHTKSGIFLGLGIIFMLWTVLMLTSDIENTFNDIWQVKKTRGFFRTCTDYLAMFFLIPIIIVLTSGISIFVGTIFTKMNDYMLLGPLVRSMVFLMPYLFMSLIFTTLYVFMPNTRVKLRYAVIPGILAGVAMQWLQFFYIHSQIWVSSYNAIYGSFAALPLFMLWVQISWSICLFGAELCYTSQNSEDYIFTDTHDISYKYRLLLCCILLSVICKRFDEGQKPYTVLKLKLATNIPTRIISDLLYDMVQSHLVIEISNNEKDEESTYLPAESTGNISIGMMIDRLESQGKWTLNIDLRKTTSELWGRAYNIRKAYINSSRDILLKDL